MYDLRRVSFQLTTQFVRTRPKIEMREDSAGFLNRYLSYGTVLSCMSASWRAWHRDFPRYFPFALGHVVKQWRCMSVVVTKIGVVMGEADKA